MHPPSNKISKPKKRYVVRRKAVCSTTVTAAAFMKEPQTALSLAKRQAIIVKTQNGKFLVGGEPGSRRSIKQKNDRVLKKALKKRPITATPTETTWLD